MASESALSLPEVLRELRERRGLSKRALSYKAGLSASYVGKLEAGLIEPSVRAFAVIALALGLSSAETLFCVRCAIALARSDVEGGNVPLAARIMADDLALSQRRQAVN